MNKKLLLNTLLVSFTFSSLTACGSGTSGGAAALPSSTANMSKSKTSTSNSTFTGVWANIIGLDSRHETSHLSLVPENHSNYSFQFMGCDGDSSVSAANPGSMDIPPGYSAASTKDYNEKWKPLFNDGEAPLESRIYDHALKFDHSSLKGGR